MTPYLYVNSQVILSHDDIDFDQPSKAFVSLVVQNDGVMEDKEHAG